MIRQKSGVYTIKSVLDKTVDTVVIILMAMIVIVVSIQVFSRYVLNNPLTWSEELARYLFVWIVFTASVVVFRENRHMSVDFFVSLFPDSIRKKFDFTVNLITTVFLIVMIYASPEILTVTMRQLSPTLNIPMAAIYLAFPAALFLMLVELVFRVLCYITNSMHEEGNLP
ncbi:TRAP transporter small permease [Marispirochaeta sp.]|jgi:TRAP-type transport system small permease protein|uniref:TRAP transporter small permease n=1 Tax=Marispirochaeta sp. TaxID=2038653 RepID=UPI0029C64A0D|nr:TRAP transporter small permease [Marispirochaeta sp.]